MKMKNYLLALIFAPLPWVSAFASHRLAPTSKVWLRDVSMPQQATKRRQQFMSAAVHQQEAPDDFTIDNVDKGISLPVSAAAMILATFSLPTEACAATISSGGAIPSALWAYAHYFSILVITGCLTAERLIVKPNMAVEDENTIVKLDLIYGLMAALLIISGFARATNFGKGGDFYIHEPLFWVKMTVSGVWGGLSLFPSLTFYKRNFARKNNEEVLPLSEKLTNRLHQIINAEISAILSIPILATLMSRGVGYSSELPWPVGLVASLAATGGSFFFYARQALTWTEDSGVSVVEDKDE